MINNPINDIEKTIVFCESVNIIVWEFSGRFSPVSGSFSYSFCLLKAQKRINVNILSSQKRIKPYKGV